MSGRTSRLTKLAAAALQTASIALALNTVLVGGDAQAHSASDAYLTLSADQSIAGHRRLIHGEWDIALRDLDFVLKLDDDGDGRLSWGEVRRHQAAIEAFAYRHLDLQGDGVHPCRIAAGRKMLIDAHADGAYAALLFDVICEPAPHKIRVSYSLFFEVDPSHRAIVVMHSGDAIATAVLSPQNPHIDLPP